MHKLHFTGLPCARGGLLLATAIACLSAAFVSTAPLTADEPPLGFQVLGTRVHDYVDSIPIPSGFSEQAPETNFVLPTLTQAETDQGYLAFTNSYLDPVYPSTRPLREQIADQLSMFSALGEYEAGTFSVHALNNMQDVQVLVGDLSGPGGSTIDGVNIDIRTVRCMPRRVWAEPRYVVKPTLLEKRPQIDIDQNTTQQFWVTAYVPPDTVPGQYSGTIQISPGAGAPESSFALNLEVLDLELSTPPTLHGMYYNPTYMTTWPDPLHPDRLYNDIMNMKEHGMNTLCVSYPTVTDAQRIDGQVVFDLSPMQPFGDACEQAGFEEIVYNVVLSELISNPLGSWATMIKAYAAGFRERGWPDLIASVADEADVTPERQAVAMSRLSYLSNNVPEMNTYQNIAYPENSEVFEPWADIRAFSSYMDETVVAPTQAAGKELWMYSGTADYGLDPKGDRLYRGIWASKLQLDGALQWTYFQPVLDAAQPYQDLFAGNVRNNMTCWVFPGVDGPLPSPGWEGMREGIEDEKYAYTMTVWIGLAEMVPDFSSSLTAIAQSADQYIQQVYDQVDTSPRPNDSIFPIRRASDNLDADFFDDFRRNAAAYIQQLVDQPAWKQSHGDLRVHISYDSNFSPDVSADSQFDLKAEVGSGAHVIAPSGGHGGVGGAMITAGQKASYYDSDSLGAGMLQTVNAMEGTVEFWIAPNFDGATGVGGPGSMQALFVSGDGVWSEGLQIFILNNNFPDDGGQLFAYWDDGANSITFNNSTLQPSGGDVYGAIAEWEVNQWHHVLFAWDEDTLGLYMDGGTVAEVARPAGGDVEFLKRGFWVGGYSGDGLEAQDSWQGWIDDLLIWDQARPMSGFAGDLNGDGFVGQTDLDIVLAEWGQTVVPGVPADPTGDGFVGQGDLDTVLADWGQGTPPSAVPEPATLAFLALGALSITRRRRLDGRCGSTVRLPSDGNSAGKR